jgi:hypothetical protein
MSEQIEQTVNKDFWAQVEEAEKAGGGGGTIVNFKIGFGWKVFTKASMLDKNGEPFANKDTFFEYKPGDKEDTKRARALANQFVLKNGITANPYNVFELVLYKDSVLGKEVTWKSDKYFYFFPNSNFYIEYVAKHLRESPVVKAMGKYWGSATWANDMTAKPRLVQKNDADGNQILDEDNNPVMEDQYPLNAYITKVFADKFEAMKEAGVEDTASSNSTNDNEVPMPDGYDAVGWIETMNEIRSEAKKGAKAQKIATDYGLTIAVVKKILE